VPIACGKRIVHVGRWTQAVVVHRRRWMQAAGGAAGRANVGICPAFSFNCVRYVLGKYLLKDGL